ncbi:hypothetical protein HU200_048132 [Digitaria exilis]|uniref:Uncharacterized protein n=1 Tax=Digitaria exilis TaxID=1010633 RepID=A0A835AVB1_9POAL|nr:hypothetical protein HU200_048132 [Digitaria exilis]
MPFCFFARFTITYANNLTFATVKTHMYCFRYGCRVAAMLLQKIVPKNAFQWLKDGWTMSLFDRDTLSISRILRCRSKA